MFVIKVVEKNYKKEFCNQCDFSSSLVAFEVIKLSNVTCEKTLRTIHVRWSIPLVYKEYITR
jgi:hypothetical protein